VFAKDIPGPSATRPVLAVDLPLFRRLAILALHGLIPRKRAHDKPNCLFELVDTKWFITIDGNKDESDIN
jgi:hypothetical protein